MRHVGDTLVWLGMILLVVAVIYYTPRLAKYVAASTATEHGAACPTCREIMCRLHAESDSNP